MKSIIQALLSMLLILGPSATVLATPPNKENCDDPDVYERLKCKQGAIANQLAYTSDDIFAEGTKLHGRMSPAHINHIKKSKDKSIRAKKKNDKAFFERQAKSASRGNKGHDLGHLVPLPIEYDSRYNDNDYNGDGICDYEQPSIPEYDDAWCLAIEPDEFGDPQKCNPNKKNKGKGKGGSGKFDGFECDRFTDYVDDEEDIKESAEQLEASYDVVEDNLIEMNNALTVINDTSPLLVFNNADGCVIPSTDPALNAAVILLRHIHASTFGAARIMADIMGQTGLGFNARAGAAGFDSAALVARLALNAAEDIQRAESGEMQAAIMECAAKTADAVAELRAEIAALKLLMQKEHVDIMANDDQNTTEIINVLNTPHGQRDQHPKP